MDKEINEKGEMVLKRTDFMQCVAITCYHQIAIIAITNMTLDGAYEQAIAEFLISLYKSRPLHRPKILELLKETGVDGITKHAFYKVAELILNSHIPEKIT
jgi:hypothetical protein